MAEAAAKEWQQADGADIPVHPSWVAPSADEAQHEALVLRLFMDGPGAGNA
ncbi:MAG: hypothetical protein ACREOH_20420 [Candidatus Entotheonellia bacterium]